MIKILWVPNVGQTKDHARSVVVGVVGVLSVGKVVTWQRSQRSWVSRTLLSQRVTEGSMCNETISPVTQNKKIILVISFIMESIGSSDKLSDKIKRHILGKMKEQSIYK